MKRKIGFTATPMSRNWIRALYVVWKRRLLKMDQNVLISVFCIILLLIQIFILVTAVRGQERPQGLQIGDKVPDVAITNIINHPTGSAKISDFKGKLLILDFWATWCAPCVSMMPRMHKLQQQYEGKVQFLPVAYQSREVVSAFLDKLKAQKAYMDIKLPEVTGDTVLRKLFPHVYLPHYVWINGVGEVVAITSYDKVNAGNIEKMLDGNRAVLAVKKDLRILHDKSKPMFIAGNAGNPTNVLYRSILTGYVDGLGGGFTVAKGDSIVGERITAWNLSRASLYRLAYGERVRAIRRNMIILDVRDPGKLVNHTQVSSEYQKWMREGSGFCYELIVSAPHLNRFKLMQDDLRKFFPQYTASIEKRKVKCLALVRTSNEDKLQTAGGPVLSRFDGTGGTIRNAYLSSLIAYTYAYFYDDSPYQIINETNYLNKVDMDLIGDLGDIVNLNQQLAKYDLKFIEVEREREVLVIRDAENSKDNAS